MKRVGILAAMKKFFEAQQIQSAFEIRIDPQTTPYGLIEKRRSVFITQLPQADQHQLLDLLDRNDIADREIRFYANLNDLEHSDLIDRESFEIENNWRGRILRFGQDFNWQIDEAEFQRVMLKSFFRLILSRVNGEYFGKHDIAPVFYNPGQSTAGFDDFRGPVEGVVKFINRGREYGRCPADPYFDVLRVFVTIGMGQAYQQLNINQQPEILVGNLFTRIDNYGENPTSEWLYQQINQAWHRN
jgi:hypothetical protein